MRGVRYDPERREAGFLRRSAPFAGSRVLEIGSGDGRLTRKLAGTTQSMVSMDITAKDLQKARSQQPERLRHKVRFAVDSAEALSFRDDSFDVVLLSWSL